MYKCTCTYSTQLGVMPIGFVGGSGWYTVYVAGSVAGSYMYVYIHVVAGSVTFQDPYINKNILIRKVS